MADGRGHEGAFRHQGSFVVWLDITPVPKRVTNPVSGLELFLQQCGSARHHKRFGQQDDKW